MFRDINENIKMVLRVFKKVISIKWLNWLTNV